jgi:hypothetical protein
VRASTRRRSRLAYSDRFRRMGAVDPPFRRQTGVHHRTEPPRRNPILPTASVHRAVAVSRGGR